MEPNEWCCCYSQCSVAVAMMGVQHHQFVVAMRVLSRACSLHISVVATRVLRLVRDHHPVIGEL